MTARYQVSILPRLVLTSALVTICSGCVGENPVPENITQGVVIQQAEMFLLQEELAKAITAAPANVMKQSGLAGALGGVHVKLLKSGTHEIFLPIPQLADGQTTARSAITPRVSSGSFEK